MEQLKENVKEFNENVADNGGYLYTTNASLSSILSNERISRVVDELISCNTLNIIDIGGVAPIPLIFNAENQTLKSQHLTLR